VPVRSRGLTTAVPLLALAVVGALDVVHSARNWPVPVIGLLDEPAHLLTAWLVLAALGAGGLHRPLPPVAPWVLLGSVAIDVDHIPLYLWSGPVAHQGSRPVTHSLLTVVVLLLLGAATRRRVRTAALGLGAGVALHLVRDVALWGPGIPLLWPADSADVRLPYGVYLVVLGAATALALTRGIRSREVSVPGGR
jgi:inner membrane protein